MWLLLAQLKEAGGEVESPIGPKEEAGDLTSER